MAVSQLRAESEPELQTPVEPIAPLGRAFAVRLSESDRAWLSAAAQRHCQPGAVIVRAGLVLLRELLEVEEQNNAVL